MGPGRTVTGGRRESALTGQPFALSRCPSDLPSPAEGVTQPHASSTSRQSPKVVKGPAPGERETPYAEGRRGKAREAPVLRFLRKRSELGAMHRPGQLHQTGARQLPSGDPGERRGSPRRPRPRNPKGPSVGGGGASRASLNARGDQREVSARAGFPDGSPRPGARGTSRPSPGPPSLSRRSGTQCPLGRPRPRVGSSPGVRNP